MRDFIERLQAKPEHIRRRIAFFSSAGITALVAVAWFGAFASSNTFALNSSSSGGGLGEGGQIGTLVQETGSGFEDLLGAVGAVEGNATPNTSGLMIVDGEAYSTLDRESNVDERTVIPF